MTQVVSFRDYTPAARFDGNAWLQVRIEEAAARSGPYTAIDTITFAVEDPDPTNPAARSFTTENGTAPELWYRLVFLDGFNGESIPTAPVKNTVGTIVEPLAATEPYVDVETLKAVLNIRAAGGARDPRCEAALAAATAAINSACDRDFHRPDETAADEERYYTPNRPRTLEIDDVLEIHELATDTSGVGNFDTVWEQDRDFTLEPLNAAAKRRPYERVKVHPYTRYLLSDRPRSVRVTGVFGWPEVPATVITMCTILATKLYKRPDAAFGIASFGNEVAMQVLRTDPDYMLLLGDYLRDPIVY